MHKIGLLLVFSFVIAMAPAHAQCRIGDDKCVEIGPPRQLTPAEIQQQRREAERRAALQREREAREAEWKKRIGEHRAKEAARLAELQAAAEAARKQSQNPVSTESEVCRRLRESPTATALCK